MCIHYVIYRYAHVLGIHLVSFLNPTHAAHVGSGNGTSIHHDIWTVVNYKAFDFGLQAIQPYYLPSGILCFYHLQMQFLCFNQFLVGGFQCFHSYNKYIGFLGSLQKEGACNHYYALVWPQIAKTMDFEFFHVFVYLV